jgi:predicted P-loop ATPase
MKKKIISELKVDNPKNFKDIQKIFEENQMKDEFEKVKLKLEEYQTPREKINFLSRVKTDYLQNLDFKTLVASGEVSHALKLHQELFFDRLVVAEINHWTEVEKNYLDSNFSKEDVLKDLSMQVRITKLKYMGVIDFLLKNQTQFNNVTDLSKLLAPILGGTSESIRKAIERVNSDFDNYSKKEVVQQWIVRNDIKKQTN